MNWTDLLKYFKMLHKKSAKMMPDNRGCPGNESILHNSEGAYHKRKGSASV
jgi:hypothetical protein